MILALVKDFRPKMFSHWRGTQGTLKIMATTGWRLTRSPRARGSRWTSSATCWPQQYGNIYGINPRGIVIFAKYGTGKGTRYGSTGMVLDVVLGMVPGMIVGMVPGMVVGMVPLLRQLLLIAIAACN